MYDENSGRLEVEADEDTRVGVEFLEHQNKVRESANGSDGGTRYKEQLDKIHCVEESRAQPAHVCMLGHVGLVPAGMLKPPNGRVV